MANTNRDLTGINIENSEYVNGGVNNAIIRVIAGTFIGMHRAFSDDELFNKEEPQNLKMIMKVV